ncbi:MAG: TMEM175 family protein [Solirubrobacterales bacterium]
MEDRKDLPRLERGKDLSRIFAFTDGVFAIAITLLVLQIEVPTDVTSSSDLWQGLVDEGPDFTAFAISFLVIGMYWVSSHRFMRTVIEYDRGLIMLTLLYLAFVVLVPFTSQMMGEWGSEAPLSVTLYTINLTLVAGSSGLMQRHVLKAKLGQPKYSWDTDLSMKSSFFTAGFFLATAPLTFVFGPWTPLLWFLLRFDPYERKRNQIYKASRT